MRRVHIIAALFLAVTLSCPPVLKPADWKTGLTAGWPVENLQAWGDANLAVDFGPNGVWNYRGTWIRLSRLNPQRMAAWGDNRLAVDFGTDGLWSYDGHAWKKIAR